MSTLPVVKWLHKELSSLLECDISEEYAKNILNIETEGEVKEFIGSLLDLSIEKNRNFLNELLIKLKKPSHLQDVTVYLKPDLNEPQSKSKLSKKQASKNETENINPITQLKQQNKKSFSLFSTDSFSTKSANRRACECQASKHKLIGNCLKCGRIVCEQEGSGPCYFCGNLVCTKEEFEKISRGSNKGEKLKSDLLSRNWNTFDAINESLNSNGTTSQDSTDENLKKAIEHKNKLIDFDRTSAKRTQVIDDESDYFNTNSKWLSQKQRDLLEKKQAEVREKRFGNKLSNQTFTLDFAGRKIVDEHKNIDLKNYESEIEKILTEKPSQFANPILNQDIDSVKLKFIDDKSSNKVTKKDNNDADSEKHTKKYRLQDQELQEMNDEGMCLSMHQPWASLLVVGIKKHEGRSWYTPYRGRLWIHAGSKQPSDLDIKEVETFYKCYYSNHQIEFPNSYPTSCLLGYIDLEDCLSSETYKSKYPNGESESEFVFICKNPTELLVKTPMAGQHKIFKLEKSVHTIAKKTSVIYHDDF